MGEILRVIVLDELICVDEERVRIDVVLDAIVVEHVGDIVFCLVSVSYQRA